MIKLLTRISIPVFRSHQHTNNYTFVIFKLIKKHLKDRQRLIKPKPETYSADSNDKQKKQKQEDEMEIYDTDYDFFSRQKEMELNKDYRKIRQQSIVIPKDVGKGGFDEVVYWSEFAKTPEQIVDLVKVFNRTPVPEQIQDKIRFQAFGDNVMKTAYLSADFDTLQEFATFGCKYSINEPSFWQKIQEKTIRIIPKNPIQAKDCIDIAFIMSKMGQGQLIYSSLFNLFKNMEITTEDKAKLLLVYANTETGQKEWVQSLVNSLVQNLKDCRKQVFIQVLKVFQKSKTLSSQHERKIMVRIEELLPELNFRELCLVGSFVGHGKMPVQFWKKLQNYLIPQIPKKKPKFTTLHLLELLSSYSMPSDFTKSQLLPLLRNNQYELIHEFRPEILSSISKILYIYELDNETKDIQELIQTRIIKVYNTLKNVEVDCLIKVIKDYAVTRNGSRELYIFLEQVADALLVQIAKKRQNLETLCALYENSQLCSPQFLKKLQFSI